MRALLFETRTGNPVVDLECTAWSCDTGILAPDKIDLTVPAYTRRARAMDMRGLLTPFKYSVALVDETVRGDRVVVAAGPIVQVVTNQDDDGSGTWKVMCYGPERLLEYRHVRLHPGWPLVDTLGLPTGTYDMNFTGLEYGTIMKRLVAESEKWVGGDLPIMFEADRAGTRERNFAAIDGKPVTDALDEIADLENGVEYDFHPVINDVDEVSWVFRTGTDTVRTISGALVPVWNLGGVAQDVRGYERTLSPDAVATGTVFTGGKDNDRVMVAAATDSTLTDDGWPRVEVWDSSHSSVSVQDTLQGWADGRLSGPTERVKFDVHRDQAHRLRHGDQVMLQAQGHWDMPDGETWWRVLSVSRSSSTPDWVGVQLV